MTDPDYLAQVPHHELLRLTAVGNVDDGKSTLIGRLLYDTNFVFHDHLASLEQDTKKRNFQTGPLDFSLLVNGLQAERERSITIDVAYRYFFTATRKFILADCPGHEEYIQNMLTGASWADLAVIVVDVQHELQFQTKRQCFLLHLLGVRHFIVVINKMDLLDYGEKPFLQLKASFQTFASKMLLPGSLSDPNAVSYIPISALQGDNIVSRSLNMPWYDGMTLLKCIESVPIAPNSDALPFRFPVQRVVYTEQKNKGFSGIVVSGTIRQGEEILVLPLGQKAQVKSILTFDGELTQSCAHTAVTLRFENDLEVGRGALLASIEDPPCSNKTFESMIAWLSPQPLRTGSSYLIKQTTNSIMAEISALQHRIDIDTSFPEPAQELRQNEIGRAQLELEQPFGFDSYAKNRHTGSFIIIDCTSNATVGVGVIVD